MPPYLMPLHVDLPLHQPHESANERRDRYRGKLKIATPVVLDEDLRKRWYGAPPSRPELARRPDTLAF